MTKIKKSEGDFFLSQRQISQTWSFLKTLVKRAFIQENIFFFTFVENQHILANEKVLSQQQQKHLFSMLKMKTLTLIRKYSDVFHQFVDEIS